MIKQGIINDGILEKKFKILRTSIMLGNARNSSEILTSYEETAREIDKIRCSLYEELLAGKMYTTTSLEEERDRLSDLISFTEKRISDRNDFIDDYIRVTNNFLDGLSRISNEGDLPQYRTRLNTINEYLSNCEEIKRLNSELKEKREELQEKYESKSSNDSINSRLENELIDEFNKLTSSNEYYSSLNYTDIDGELVKIDNNLKEKREVMNTFTSSYDALKNAGISGSERDEYLSYVNDAKKDYYNELNKKYVLNIYKLVLDKENNYDLLYQKRLYIENILKDRIKSREELDITSRDELEQFSTLCNEQFSIIKSQKINIDGIERLVVEIADCESRLDELDKDNDKFEIKELLKEYFAEKPDIVKVDLPTYEDNSTSDESSGGVSTNNRPSNMVIRVSDPVKINVKGASDTAKLVMKKVVIVLEPKRFNNKKNKLKEAELEIKKDEHNHVENENIVNSSNINVTKNDSVSSLDSQDVFNNDSTFVTLDASGNTDSNYDDVFVPESLNVTLDTNTSSGVTKDYSASNVKINISGNNVTIPTEIFVDEASKETMPDLFNQTDPFLDDNQFEIENSGSKDKIVSTIPEIGNIGSVKPTSMLSKIEDVARDNDDIILPTMGLTSDDKTSVPIVSENYIN